MRADASWRGMQEGEDELAGRSPAAARSSAVERCWPRGFAFADREAIGLRCDLERLTPPAAADSFLTVIQIDGRELADLLLESGDRQQASAAFACPVRRRLARQRVGRCFVAMTKAAEPCFVQWLLDHTDNQALRHGFGDVFPHLLRDEALLEGTFIPAPFRAPAIVPSAMPRIAARAAAQGVRWVHSFVPVEDEAMLRATRAAGFALHQLRMQRRRLWRRTTGFGPLPADLRLRWA